ncbi:MAG: TetR/AcrR family transcriptional regulator, partial [Comamonadaceae bacterium]
FNRFGEPNVSTTLVAAELGISPGNLYYHYPAKDELIWRHRFLYRDLNDLLSKNRLLETRFQGVLASKVKAIRALLGGMARAGHVEIDLREVDALAQSMVVVLTYWLSYEYVRNPREALEPAHAQGALLRGAQHTLHLLAPYLVSARTPYVMRATSAPTLSITSAWNAASATWASAWWGCRAITRSSVVLTRPPRPWASARATLMPWL